MPIPLYGFVYGDTIGLLVFADENEPVSELAKRLQDAARLRIKPCNKPAVVWKGSRLDLGSTVAQAGLMPLDRFDVLPEEKL